MLSTGLAGHSTMFDIVIGSVSFTALVIVLVVVVLIARHWLQPTSDVEMLINDRSYISTTGRNLLRALSDNKIFLPAACAGRGICGQCKVTFVDCDSPPLPTEAGHLTRSEARHGVRMACAHKLRDRTVLQLPPHLLEIEQHRCELMTARNVSAFLREFVFAMPEGRKMSFRAGQYVLVEVPAHTLRYAEFDIEQEYRRDWQESGALDLVSSAPDSVTRAYSIASSPAVADRIELLVRIALPPPGSPKGTPPGIVSSYLYGLSPGDTLLVSGPYGEFGMIDSEREKIFIAGGAGIAPMRAILLEALSRPDPQPTMSLWYGARSQRDLCYEHEFTELAARYRNFSWHAALSESQHEDEWSGATGFIHTVLLEQYLESHPEPEEAEYYVCGPPVMSRSVINMLEDLGVDKSSICVDDFGGEQ